MDRKFDISWIQQIPSESSTALAEAERSAAVKRESFSSSAVRDVPEGLERTYLAILATVHRLGGECHVVDIAETLPLDFDIALRYVVRLAGRQELTILRRDPVASDHLIGLTPQGLEHLAAA